MRDLVRRFKGGYVQLVQSQNKDPASGSLNADKTQLLTGYVEHGERTE